MEDRHVVVLSARFRVPREAPGAALLLPTQRSVPQHLGEPEPLRLPPVEDRLDDVRREAGERQKPADVATVSSPDRAVNEAVAQQEVAGLTVLTDGEMRRLSFQSQMGQAVEGFGEWNLDAFLWGDWHGDEAVGDWRGERPKKSWPSWLRCAVGDRYRPKSSSICVAARTRPRR
jgi:hypothetical protein